jgi:hypothetical protein
LFSIGTGRKQGALISPLERTPTTLLFSLLPALFYCLWRRPEISRRIAHSQTTRIDAQNCRKKENEQLIAEKQNKCGCDVDSNELQHVPPANEYTTPSAIFRISCFIFILRLYIVRVIKCMNHEVSGPPIRVMVRIQSSSTLSDVRPCKTGRSSRLRLTTIPLFLFSFYIVLCLLIFKLSRVSTIQLAAAVNSQIKRLIYNDREKDQRDPPGQSFLCFIKKLFGALDLAWWRSGINNSSPVSFVYFVDLEIETTNRALLRLSTNDYSPHLHIAGVAQLFWNGEFNLRVVPLSLVYTLKEKLKKYLSPEMCISGISLTHSWVFLHPTSHSRPATESGINLHVICIEGGPKQSI